MLPDFPGELQVYTLPPLLGFAVFIGIALVATFRTKRSPTTRLFAVICFLASLISIDVALVSLINDERLALQVDRLVYLVFIFSLPIYIQFVHSFLNIRNRKGLEYIAYACCTALLFFTQSDLFITGFNKYFFGKIAKAGPVFHLFSLAGSLTVVYCSYTLFIYLKRAQDGYERNRIKYILGGIGVSTVLVLLNALPVSGVSIYPMGNFVFLPAIFLAFGVLKYDLLDIDTVLRRCVLYFLLTGILSLFYFFLIYVLNLWFMNSGWYNPYGLPFVLSLFMVLLFNPLKNKVQHIVDRLLFRGKYDYHKTLREISEKMASLLKMEEIVELLSSSIGSALQITHINIFLSGDGNRGSTIYSGEENTEKTFVAEQLTASHPFIRFLERSKKPLSREMVEGLPISTGEEQNIHKIFDLLGASMAIPMISRDHLTGILIIGGKKTGEVSQ
jgi:two-component system, NtrC family, sensor kinase